MVVMVDSGQVLDDVAFDGLTTGMAEVTDDGAAVIVTVVVLVVFVPQAGRVVAVMTAHCGVGISVKVVQIDAGQLGHGHACPEGHAGQLAVHGIEFGTSTLLTTGVAVQLPVKLPVHIGAGLSVPLHEDPGGQ